VSVLESDIAISYDGIPFLIHDPILDRTTNVDEVFPERRRDPGSSFLISEIAQLDAGSWFGDGMVTTKVTAVFISQAVGNKKCRR
jgi:glycerophosphoryl diester phosphodiesterase